ncbi:MAG: hypothetical protein ACOCRK_11940 [bacterium]
MMEEISMNVLMSYGFLRLPEEEQQRQHCFKFKKAVTDLYKKYIGELVYY